MARCFPFPPPGYEETKWPQLEDVLEKHKEKKHKKDKGDKEKGEGKEKKHRSKHKHKDKDKDKKDRKEKHRDKKKHKDKDRDKSKEERTGKHDEVKLESKHGEGSSKSEEAKSFTFTGDQGRSIGEEGTASGSKAIGNFLPPASKMETEERVKHIDAQHEPKRFKSSSTKREEIKDFKSGEGLIRNSQDEGNVSSSHPVLNRVPPAEGRPTGHRATHDTVKESALVNKARLNSVQRGNLIDERRSNHASTLVQRRSDEQGDSITKKPPNLVRVPRGSGHGAQLSNSSHDTSIDKKYGDPDPVHTEKRPKLMSNASSVEMQKVNDPKATFARKPPLPPTRNLRVTQSDETVNVHYIEKRSRGSSLTVDAYKKASTKSSPSSTDIEAQKGNGAGRTDGLGIGGNRRLPKTAGIPRGGTEGARQQSQQNHNVNPFAVKNTGSPSSEGARQQSQQSHNVTPFTGRNTGSPSSEGARQQSQQSHKVSPFTGRNAGSPSSDTVVDNRTSVRLPPNKPGAQIPRGNGIIRPEEPRILVTNKHPNSVRVQEGKNGLNQRSKDCNAQRNSRSPSIEAAPEHNEISDPDPFLPYTSDAEQKGNGAADNPSTSSQMFDSTGRSVRPRSPWMEQKPESRTISGPSFTTKRSNENSQPPKSTAVPSPSHGKLEDIGGTMKFGDRKHQSSEMPGSNNRRVGPISVCTLNIANDKQRVNGHQSKGGMMIIKEKLEVGGEHFHAETQTHRMDDYRTKPSMPSSDAAPAAARPEEIGKKRKEPELNGVIQNHDMGSTKVVKMPVENGRLPPPHGATQFTLKGPAIRNVVPSEKLIESRIINASSRSEDCPPKGRLSLEEELELIRTETGIDTSKLPHPASRTLNKLFDLPAVPELPECDDGWLMSSNSKGKRKREEETKDEDFLKAWDRPVRVEALDVTIMPYVFPF